ncbi:MAG TPA: SMP-30/gluconolactonase/LRE family protein [Luteimonas sp.]|nr:SMP-30/gluconolactonase/LRE family protein [Luteimonas sp.]
MRRRSLLAGLPALALAAALPACGGRNRPGLEGDAGLPVPRPLSDLRLLAEGLASPEGVATFPDGRVAVSATGAACVLIEPDGALRRIGQAPAPAGLTIDREGRVIIANFGLLHDTGGPLQRLDLASGRLETLVDAVDGRRLVASNAPAIGPDGAIYCTHSTWSNPSNVGTTEPTGFVYRVTREGEVSIVADRIRGANGCCFDADFRHLFVAQTAAGNVLRYRRQPGGGYADRQVWGGQLGEAPDNITVPEIFEAMDAAGRSTLGHPDGVALDVRGNLWVTLPFSNRIVAVSPEGRIAVVIDDPHAVHLQMPTNLAWGGRNLRDLYIVSRRNGRVYRLDNAGEGLAMPHWR